MPVVVNYNEAQANSRLVLISVLDLNLRLMENWRRLQNEITGKTLDYESTMIMMAIVSIAASKMLRTDVDSSSKDLAEPLQMALLTSVNLLSIAAATSLNRETVRCKVKLLAHQGLVERHLKYGIRIPTRVMQHPALRNVLMIQLDALRQTMNQLMRQGVVERRR